MLSIIREAGRPDPLCNVPYAVAPGVVLRPDFRIPSLALVVEGDGRDGHEDVEFEISDDERDAYYRRLGNTVMRVGWWEAKRERGKVVGRLASHRERCRR
jgi:very-short-patch-repair endonuclease